MLVPRLDYRIRPLPGFNSWLTGLEYLALHGCADKIAHRSLNLSSVRLLSVSESSLRNRQLF